MWGPSLALVSHVVTIPKPSKLEGFRVLKLSNLATGTSSQMGPYKDERGQTGQNWDDFCKQAYFYKRKISYLATHALRQKEANLWGFC